MSFLFTLGHSFTLVLILQYKFSNFLTIGYFSKDARYIPDKNSV